MLKNSIWEPRWKVRSKFDTFIDFNSDVTPAAKITRNMLAIFDPITLPNEMSGEPFIKASIETTSSQRDVPNPMTISPIKNSEIFSFLPIAIALEIRISAPFTRSKSPKINDIKLISIVCSNYLVKV